MLKTVIDDATSEDFNNVPADYSLYTTTFNSLCIEKRNAKELLESKEEIIRHVDQTMDRHRSHSDQRFNEIFERIDQLTNDVRSSNNSNNGGSDNGPTVTLKPQAPDKPRNIRIPVEYHFTLGSELDTDKVLQMIALYAASQAWYFSNRKSWLDPFIHSYQESIDSLVDHIKSTYRADQNIRAAPAIEELQMFAFTLKSDKDDLVTFIYLGENHYNIVAACSSCSRLVAETAVEVLKKLGFRPTEHVRILTDHIEDSEAKTGNKEYVSLHAGSPSTFVKYLASFGMFLEYTIGRNAEAMNNTVQFHEVIEKLTSETIRLAGLNPDESESHSLSPIFTVDDDNGTTYPIPNILLTKLVEGKAFIMNGQYQFDVHGLTSDLNTFWDAKRDDQNKLAGNEILNGKFVSSFYFIFFLNNSYIVIFGLGAMKPAWFVDSTSNAKKRSSKKKMFKGGPRVGEVLGRKVEGVEVDEHDSDIEVLSSIVAKGSRKRSASSPAKSTPKKTKGSMSES